MCIPPVKNTSIFGKSIKSSTFKKALKAWYVYFTKKKRKKKEIFLWSCPKMNIISMPRFSFFVCWKIDNLTNT